MEALGVILVVVLVGLYLFLPWFLLYKSHNTHKLCRLIKALPTSKTRGVFMGLVEVKGSIESEEPLTSFLAEKQCVWYQYSVEEHWRRLVTESYTDSQGNRRTRTRVEEGWTTLDSGGDSQNFYLQDDTGTLLIQPEGAKIEADTIFNTRCDRSDPLYYQKGPQRSIANSTHKRRFTEKALPLHRLIYIIGTARERSDIVAPEIASCEKKSHFIISTREEEELLSHRRLISWLQTIGGLLIWAGIPLAVYLAEDSPPSHVFHGLPVWGWFCLIYLFVWILSRTWIIYNWLIDLRNRVRQGKSLIDVQLQRRHDLIPQLVNIIKAYMEHEKGVQARIAELRANTAALEQEKISIRLIEESYPELDAEPMFSQLSKQLKDTEDRIALAREYYNTITNHYNTTIQVFPESLLASLARLKTHSLFSPDIAQP